MDKSVKIAAACSVLVGGILLALMFRDEPAETGRPVPETGNELVLRQSGQLPADQNVPGPDHRRQDPSDPTAAAPGPDEKAAPVLVPMGPGRAPPELERSFHQRNSSGTSRWNTDVSINLPEVTRPDAASRTHKIIDGDSLRILAEQYLGSADRYLEIYEANRDRLPSAELLPIGVELKIPSRAPPADPFSPSVEATGERPLVPIAGGSVGR